MLFAVIEIVTPQMTTIWLAASSGVALIVAFFLPNVIWLQILVFVLVSVILLIFTRKLSQRILKGKKKRLNADRCIDQQAVVTEDINNLLGKGQVNIKGAIWTARSENDEIIQKGELVTVKRIEGVKVIVNKI
jgi:membrane protein implicated in regulation of membrane protease activity